MDRRHRIGRFAAVTFVVAFVAEPAPAGATGWTGVAAAIAPAIQASGQGQGQTQPPPDPQTQGVRETVVVSASKTEQRLVDAPATMTVIGPATLAVAPSNNYADLLRAVPGINITQISARDVNVNSRASTSSLATAQLAVVDGRSVYLDFFGFTMWEFMPSDLNEIKQIEIIRGPASAVWGANALNGVINVITKSPREMVGSTATFGGGTFDRPGMSNGAMFYARGTHAQVLNDRWAYKVGAGFYDSDPLARPTGTIPNGTGTMYPAFVNQGTRQPKVDARFDYDAPDGESQIQISGGVTGTDGMMHTGIGPFRIERGATMAYGKFQYTRRAFKLQAFLNALDGEAANVVAMTPAGVPLGLDFSTRTFDVEVGDTRVVGTRHAITWGGNLRYNGFDLTIAPGEDSRTEGGVYVQDEMVVNNQFRLIAGARIDKFSSIDNAVFSPRVAAVFKPRPDQSIRVSYNRAFRAPSMINNNLEATIATPLPLGLVNAAFGNQVFLVPTTANGNPDLKEESVDAFEVAYTGSVRDRAVVSIAVFYTRYKDGIYFTQTGAWLTAPPGFPGLGPFTPNQVWAGVVNAGFIFPSSFTYLNLGEVKNKGIELGIDGRLTDIFSAFANYSFQADPKPTFPGLTPDEAIREINLPSKHQVNVGMSASTARYYGTLTVSRSSRAFWQDVLDARFHGFTPAFTSVNLTAGVKWSNGRYGLAFKGTNLANRTIQQHIFGDIVKRQVGVELRVTR